MTRPTFGSLRTAVLATALAVGVLGSDALAQGGYKKQKLEQLGVELPVPNHYEALPTEPTEEWIANQWVLKASKMRKAEKDHDNPFPQPEPFRPTLQLVWIDYVADPAPKTGEDAPPPPPQPDDPRIRIIVNGNKKPTNSLERYLENEQRGYWELGPAEEQKPLDDTHTCKIYELRPGKYNDTGLRGWAYEIKSTKNTVAFIGFCEEPEWKDHTKIWEEMASEVEFFEPDGKDVQKLRDFYERRPKFVDPEYRIQIRQNLVRGWKAEDTENYIFIFDTKDEKLLRKLMKDIEAIREEYIALFPPAGPLTAVSTVRICKSLDEYHQYGGPEGSGGYWNSQAKELVFFDYEDEKGEGRGSGTANTLIVLYHEAFHQYIFYSVGELAPHSWYNEGTGDYFSGAKITGGKFKGIDVNPWRIEYIQEQLRNGVYIPWKQISRYEQAEYYNPAKVGLCYAQGWSMILRASKAADQHEVL
ncbi:MAG: hypothetical protein R3F34_12725 [Planctomycetota bacterium]